MNMYCYQCEQTSHAQACTRVGVCGKAPEVSSLQDLLVHELKGIGSLAHRRANSAPWTAQPTASSSKPCSPP